MFKLFSNGLVLQPDFSLCKTDILVQDDTIYDLIEPGKTPGKPVDSEVDLGGQVIFPGLINSHDHLIDTCWKGLGTGDAENWFDWDKNLRTSEEYKLLQRLSVTDLYVVGMYKNSISGATTVVDHFPAEVSATFANHPLVSLLEHFYLAHSISTQQLQWGKNTSEQFKQARGILPFVLHCGEGKGKEIREELETLNRLGALEKNTVLVNGCCLSEQDLQLIAIKGASLVWLPSSSQKVFGQQPDINKILELNIPLTIGTDSSISGSLNILEELKFALNYSQQHLNSALSAKDLLKMVTIDAAAMFGIEKQLGSLTPGRRADFIVFPENEKLDVFSHFISMRPENYSMVVHRGMMVVGNDEYRKMSSIDFSLYSEVRINGVAKILYGQPIQLLERIRHKLDRDITFPFFNVTAEE